MKTSIIPLCYGKQFTDGTMSQEDWIKEAVELGLDGIELYEPFLSSLDSSGKASLAEAIHNAGLEVSKYASGCYAHTECCLCNPQEREQAIAYVKQSVDEAAIFRTDTVRVVSGVGGKGLEHEVVLQSVADGLRACLDYAEEKRVMLAFEDHFGVGTNIDDFMKILELVDDERLKVNLDTANATNGTAVDLARLVAARVVNTHLSDRKGHDHAIVVGKGDVDFGGVFSELKKADYDGWLSLEVFVGGKENLQFSVDHVRNAWNDA
ncbi:MAG: sugar phosphate isomerase/epimerase family protein [Pseudomonadales bacterium]|nr:sugar phosphate isomerase/epimerase family protein [Pseudomonadales bacterium]MDP7357418.1 sugar phosphate isomerase/epimerase family protein [Pseudomonadales bacterium]MDP7595510.1 sugar phosphate isomerase/epimerase family protein [Pseudomonadales bacterium]HJN52462.1 sugar phosphate isomerase/epimerase family protein [Pseudomonadales bacterium]